MNIEWSFEMHDCSKTKEHITELLLDGADGRDDELLAAELHACRECRAEFEALSATLRITTRLRTAAAPKESYWTGYHAKLREKLTNAAAPNIHTNHSHSWLAQFFRSSVSVSVPVPVAAALIIVCLLLIPFAIRTSEQPVVQAPAIVRVPVEVPVVQEKLVTRIVYRDRRSHDRNSTRSINDANIDGPLARSQKPRNEEVPPTLVGFKPTDEVKLTVIKGGSANEK